MKLLDQARRRLRVRHYSARTEEAYVQWIKRYVRFHGLRHPGDLGAAEAAAFLTSLAVRGRVAASTQMQALAAIVFLYREVLGKDLGRLEGLVPARRPKRLPVVLTRAGGVGGGGGGRSSCPGRWTASIRRLPPSGHGSGCSRRCGATSRGHRRRG